MRKEDHILRKLDELTVMVGGHDAKFNGLDGRFNGLDAKIDGVDARLSGQFERLAEGILELNEKMDGLATNDRVDALEDRVMTTLDWHSKMFSNLDGERLAGLNRFERIERHVGLS